MNYLLILIGIQVLLCIVILWLFFRRKGGGLSKAGSFYNSASSDNLRAHQADIPNAFILFANSEHKGWSCKIQNFTTTIGRVDGESDIVLNDRYVTRVHARIIYSEDKFIICDLNSANGTYVNGQKTIAQEIKNGDRIEIGKSTFTFKVGE